MSLILAYLAGLATIPAALLVLATIGWTIDQLAGHSYGFGCYACDRFWGARKFGGDGSPDGIARVRRWWHVTIAHPGERGRLVALDWRGWERRDWQKVERFMRAFPNPPVTVLDILARIPIIKRVVYAIARRHGRKTR